MGDMKLTDYLVRNNGIWEGSLANFVNRDGGIVQHGGLILEVSIDKHGVVTHKSILLRPDGQKKYEGIARMRLEGQKLTNLEPMTEDPNTKSKIQNHLLEGFVGDSHAFVLESYDDISPDGKIEHRRNSVHYYFVNEKELVILSDVFVDDKLLVFANARLKKREVARVP